MAWIYIIVASMFEAAWVYNLKYLDMKKVVGVRPAVLMHDAGEWRILLPLAGYIVLGLCNIYFFSQSMKTIPASTAFAVWMALALVFAKILDVFVFNEAYNYQQIFFTLVVLVGITGLKYYTK